jgi:hypothetical protein
LSLTFLRGEQNKDIAVARMKVSLWDFFPVILFNSLYVIKVKCARELKIALEEGHTTRDLEIIKVTAHPP